MSVAFGGSFLLGQRRRRRAMPRRMPPAQRSSSGSDCRRATPWRAALIRHSSLGPLAAQLSLNPYRRAARTGVPRRAGLVAPATTIGSHDVAVQTPDARVAVPPRAVGSGSPRARLAAASVGSAGGACDGRRAGAQPRLTPRPLLAGRLAAARTTLAGAPALRDPHRGAQRGVPRGESDL